MQTRLLRMVAFACVFSRARGRGVRRRDEKEDGRTKREKDEGSPGHRGQKQEEDVVLEHSGSSADVVSQACLDEEKTRIT